MPHEKAYKIALGNINIYTMEKFANFDPDTFVVSLNYIRSFNIPNLSQILRYLILFKEDAFTISQNCQ
jgi:hypothetical protein